jgi:hypothetical protein
VHYSLLLATYFASRGVTTHYPLPMTNSIRTKFECQSVMRDKHGRITVKLSAVFGIQGENKAFWESTPDGQLEIVFKDLEAAARFNPGSEE